MKNGEKIAQVKMGINSSPPADMTLYLRFGLRSDIDVDVPERRGMWRIWDWDI